MRMMGFYFLAHASSAWQAGQPLIQTPLQSTQRCPAVQLCGTRWRDEIADGRLPLLLVSFIRRGAEIQPKSWSTASCGWHACEREAVARESAAAAESRSVFPVHGCSSQALSPLHAAVDKPASTLEFPAVQIVLPAPPGVSRVGCSAQQCSRTLLLLSQHAIQGIDRCNPVCCGSAARLHVQSYLLNRQLRHLHWLPLEQALQVHHS